MVVVRRRLIIWLIKAYIKKSGKTLLFFFFVGLIIFFSLIFGSKYITKLIPFHRKAVIGVVGSHVETNLPPVIVDKLSSGLTKIEPDGSIAPALAENWVVKDNGKTYEFNLKKNVKYNDNSPITSDTISYNFSDVSIERPDKSKIIFKLKNPYAPFLTTVSKPIFKKGYIGNGNFTLRKVDLNGSFVQSLTLSFEKNRFDTTTYQFYPSEEALKMAYLLGEVTYADGLASTNFKESDFEKFPKTTVKKEVNYRKLATLFYDTTDKNLSDKKLRLALGYALPDILRQGEKAYLPYPPNSIYYNTEVLPREQDFEHARVLLPDNLPELTIKTLRKYKPSAMEIATAWNKIGIKTKIEEVEVVPDRFEVFLGDFNLPKDPDQYALWHSGQNNNIARYKNLRIDKLLEDGRKTTNFEERRKIYLDFQRFLLEDAPAAFLFFPYEYDVIRS